MKPSTTSSAGATWRCRARAGRTARSLRRLPASWASAAFARPPTPSGRSGESSTAERKAPRRLFAIESAAKVTPFASGLGETKAMCGIVGYVGKRDAGPILMEGLHRLEYRGYDSAGIACARNSKLSVHKAKGKVRELERQLPALLKGAPGIAHTRWATHGEPSDRNAHPHSDSS